MILREMFCKMKIRLLIDTDWLCCLFVSSEGALYVILPYDYPAQQPLFEHTPVLNDNFEYSCHDDFVDCDFYDDYDH